MVHVVQAGSGRAVTREDGCSLETGLGIVKVGDGRTKGRGGS